MSFIREIVETVYENESIDAKKNLTKISAEIKRFQEKTKDYIDRNYVQFLPNLTSNELYLSEGEKLVREVEDLLQNIESDTKQDLYSASEELRQYEIELNEIALGISTTYKILRIDGYFQHLEEAKSNKEYLIVMDIVGNLKSLIYDPNDKIFKKLDCYENIKIRYHIESEMLLHNLKQRFEQLVQFTEKSFQNTKSINLKISKDENQLQDIIIALFNTKYNPNKLCDFLLDNVLTPIIKKPASIHFNKNSEEYIEFSLSYDLKEVSEHLRPNYKNVFKNLNIIIHFLTYMNVEISEKISVLSVFGEHMKGKLINLLINECLLYAIPDTMDEMNESTLVEDIYNLNQYLIDSLLLIEDDDKELIKYADNIGVLFQNRFCTNILNTAIEIMQKDLHDMSLIAENNPITEIQSNPFIFQKCMISKSTLELICLMDKLVREAVTVSPNMSIRLLSTINAIINQYIIKVPEYHEKMLQNIPQQTALFHNNCMYLAHWLIKNSDKEVHSIDTLIKSLQSLGNDHFSKQLKNQKSQIMEILREFDLSDTLSEIGIEPQKIIRQCLRQLDLLKNVWQAILPDNVYNKTMSNLLNDFIGEIIRKIIAIEDIPTPLSNELVEIIGIIEERSPTLFQEQHHVIQIKLWMKLTQLKMILGASLIQITDQWSDGKGPLTLNYKPEEIKHLIRALFQNTDRRANALASII